MSKYALAFYGAVIALLLETQDIMVPCLVLITADFILGICTDIKASLKRGERFGVQSGKLWKTVFKFVGVGIAILLTQLYTNSYVDWLGVNVGKMIAGIIGGIELWSIFGHLFYLTDWYGFNYIRKVFKKEIEDKVGHKIDEDVDSNSDENI